MNKGLEERLRILRAYERRRMRKLIVWAFVFVNVCFWILVLLFIHYHILFILSHR